MKKGLKILMVIIATIGLIYVFLNTEKQNVVLAANSSR